MQFRDVRGSLDGMAKRTTLSPPELAVRWAGRVSEKTLRNWRASGRGPKYLKSAGGRVEYRLADVVRFERTTTLRRSPIPARAQPKQPQ